MRHRLRLLITPAVAFALASSTSGCAPRGETARTASAAPEFRSDPGGASTTDAASIAVATLDGEPTDLASVARGRVALVALWATWCASCVEELETLRRLDARTREGGDVVVVALAVGEERGTVEAFVRRHDAPAMQLVDEGFRFADALAQRRIPATLVLDRHGEIVFRGGAVDAAALAALRAAMANQPPTRSSSIRR